MPVADDGQVEARIQVAARSGQFSSVIYLHIESRRLPVSGTAGQGFGRLSGLQPSKESKRMADAVAVHLTPIGWTLAEFNKTGYQVLPNAAQIQESIQRYASPIHLLVAGFHQEEAYLFDVSGDEYSKGIPRRLDIPGFQAIGSGSTAASFMMFYRGLNPRTGAREALYYALEAKYFGEQASGVGGRTDLYVARLGKDLIVLDDEKTIEEKLIPICQRLEPSILRKRDKQVLNSLAELEGFDPIKEEEPKPSEKKKKASAGIEMGKLLGLDRLRKQ